MSDPVLRISFTDADGKPLLTPVEIRLPTDLKLSLATACVLDIALKRVKSGAEEALKKLGFK